MRFENLDVGKDDKNVFWGNVNFRTSDKDELKILQNYLLLTEDMMVVPQSLYNMIAKHGIEMTEFLSEKYPEDLMGSDMSKAVEHLKMITNEKN